MRIIKLIILAILGIALIGLALVNKHVVSLNIEPFGFDLFNLPTLEMPLFLIIFASVLVGMFIGILLEWVRERHIRRLARQKNREAGKLQKELNKAQKTSSSSALM